MPGQQVVRSAWSNPFAEKERGVRTTFPLAFKLGPFRLAQTGFDLTTVDFGPTAISGEKVDARFLPSNQALFLKSVPDRLGLESASVFEPMLAYRAYRYDRSWTVTEGSFESYLGSFSKTSRKGLKRRTKKLVERSGGRLDIRRYDRADRMKTFHNHARAVSAKTFQEKLMDDGIPADQSFSESMKAKASEGRCYGAVLYLDDQPISYLYCERQGSGWLAVYGGFDPAHAGFSPGTVHLLCELEALFEDPNCAFFDFGPGPSSYKQFFSTHDVPCSDILILDKTWSNQLAIAAHRMLGSLTDTGIQLAESLRVKERLRQQIRGR
jgi:hypothetical protein